jgi:hypothetical protein
MPVARRIAGLSLVLLGLLAACDDKRGASPAAGGSASPAAEARASAAPAIQPTSLRKPTGPLKEKIQGSWALRPSPETIAKMRHDLGKLGVDDVERDAQVKKFEEGLARTTMVISGDTMSTKDGDKVVVEEKYTVVKDDGQSLTLRIPRVDKEQTLTFDGDDIVTTMGEDLGLLTLTRK